MAPEDSKQPAPLAGLLLVAFGLAMVGLGLAWKYILPDSAFWSDTQAQEYTEAFEAAHAATIAPPPGSQAGHDHPGSNQPPLTEAERAQARQRFDAIKGKLASARQRRDYWGLGIASFGVFLCLAGLWTHRRAAPP